jgi:hypothetical protein
MNVWFGHFYQNLKYDCNRPDILSSSINNRDVEVTVADIAAALKCNAERNEENDQWINRPSMLTIEDVVGDMCMGQFANRHKNAASKSKLPPQLWFVDFVLQMNVCPLGHKSKEGTFSPLPCIHFTRATGAPFPRSSKCSCINSGKGRTNELRTPPEVGHYCSHSSSLIWSKRWTHH